MVNITLIKQQDEKDCGVACLAMILKHYKTEIPIHKLREFSGTDLEGTSAFGLKKCVEKLNFECQAIQADDEIWQEKDVPYPLIAHIILDNAYTHYVVIYGVKNNKLLIADPANGKIQKTIKQFSKEWTGVLLLMKPSSNYQPIKEEVAGLTSFLPILWQQKSLIFHIIIASLFITLFGIVSSYYFQGILDFFIPNQARSTLNIISIGLILVYLFRILFEYIHNYLLVILGQRMSIIVMLSYFKHVLRLPMNFFSTRKSGEIISRFLDANKIIDALASATLSVFLDIGIVFFVGITLAIQNGTLFLITLATLPFYLIAILAFVKSYDKANQEEMSAGAKLNSSIIESLKGIETIKAYNGEEKVYNRVDHEFINLMKKSFKTVTLDNIQQGIKHGIQLISSGIILWLGSYYVMDGKISLGQLITYNALLVFFTDPLQNIINLQVKMQTAQVANKRLNEIFAIDAELNKNIEVKEINETIFQQGINLKNVTFSYNMESPTFQRRIKRSRYYSCSQFRNKGAAVCHANSIKSDVAEEQVASKLSAVIQQSEVLDAVIENMNKKMIEEKEPFEKNRKSIQSRIEVTEKNIQRFLELITQASEIAEDLHVRIKELENNRYELLNQEREIENRLKQTRKSISKQETQRVLDLLGLAIKDKEKKELKEIYKTFIDKITFDKSTKEVNVHLVFNKEILRKLNSNLEKEPSSSLGDEGSFILSKVTYLIL